MNALEHKIPPPVILVFTGTAMWVLAHYTFTWHLPFTLKLIAILLFLAIALFFGPPAIMNFRKCKTTIDPVRIERASNLVTAGPFNFSRNPMYVSMLALLFAWLVYLAAPWAVLGPIFFELYILVFQIWPEERAMHDKFGATYLTYTQKVRRWI
jgi:protein-S-isoprenylcysteine O-methyltransferase Ste14